MAYCITEGRTFAEFLEVIRRKYSVELEKIPIKAGMSDGNVIDIWVLKCEDEDGSILIADAWDPSRHNEAITPGVLFSICRKLKISPVNLDLDD